MNDKMTWQKIRMYIYSFVIGLVASFGFFMFTAVLSMVAFDGVNENPKLYSVSLISFVVCCVIFAVFSVLWIVALIKQKEKLVPACISALCAVAGSICGFFGFMVLSAMLTMV